MVTALLSCVLVFSAFGSEVGAETAQDGNDFLVIQDGLLQPVLNVSSLRDPYYSNENSEVLRFCVYVETDNDTDGDGMADLVKALVQVPRAAVEGQYKAGTIPVNIRRPHSWRPGIFMTTRSTCFPRSIPWPPVIT